MIMAIDTGKTIYIFFICCFKKHPVFQPEHTPVIQFHCSIPASFVPGGGFDRFCARRRVRPATLPEFPTAAPPRGSPPVPPHIQLWRAPILPRRGLVRSPGAFSVRRPWLHAGFRYRGYSECGNTRHNSCRATDIFQFRFRRRPGAVSAFSGRKHADGTESADVQC